MDRSNYQKQGLDDGNTTLNKIGKYTLPSHVFAIGLLSTKGKSFWSVSFLVSFCYDNSKNELTYPLDPNCQNNDNRLQWPFYNGELWYVLLDLFLYVCTYQHHWK